MGRILSQEDGVWVQLSTPSEITISPALLWVIVSVAAIFFISGIVHVLLRFFTKKQTHQPVSHSNRYSELYRPRSLGRQLQQLFQLQDSGLDQSFIDSMPVFFYKDIIGLKDPFDCAVCLCEFSPHDKLRLIPICSHAFHTHCIDTWLLSNSTCPLCRVNLSMNSSSCNQNRPMENSLINISSDRDSIGINTHCDEKNLGKQELFVRLGKLKSLNAIEKSKGGEISRCNLDARRCFSMGSYQYVVNSTDLQVALVDVKDNNVGCGRSEDNREDERKIKYESFSVSKIWLWSKTNKFPVSSSEIEAQEGASSCETTSKSSCMPINFSNN